MKRIEKDYLEQQRDTRYSCMLSLMTSQCQVSERTPWLLLSLAWGLA
jgi:hypothetical protein